MPLEPLDRPVALPRIAARAPAVAWGLVAALLLALALSVLLGAVSVSAHDWWTIFDASDTMSGGAHVLWNLRLPRALLAMLVGASLGLAGALSQGLFRNPMADPGLLGVTSGAACATALVLTVFAAAQMALPVAWRIFVLPATAFCGALAACFALDRMARWLTPGSVPASCSPASHSTPRRWPWWVCAPTSRPTSNCAR